MNRRRSVLAVIAEIGLRVAPLELAVAELQRRKLIAESDALLRRALASCDTGDISVVG